MKKANYIFVDIDGVLNTRNHLKKQKKKTGTCTGMNWCPVSCNNLSRLCKKYNAGIIISSSWRHQYSLKRLKEIFQSNGIPKEYVIGKTSSIANSSSDQNYCRGHEIKDWINQNVHSDISYVIIDDNSDILESQLNHFVHTSIDEGFANPEALIEAVQIIQNYNNPIKEKGV